MSCDAVSCHSPTVRLQGQKDEFMDITTHCARITGPVSYRADSGRSQDIPIGPCLVQSVGGPCVDIVWGDSGQSSVALPIEAIKAARDHGHLVILD
jgi:hypothetical protein